MSDKPRMMAPMAMPRTPKRTMERLTLMATMTTNKKLDAVALCREPKAPPADVFGDSLEGDFLIPLARED